MLKQSSLSPLTFLEKGRPAVVHQVNNNKPCDPIAQRLRDLGVVPGAQIQIIALAPFGGDPLLVQINETRLAMYATEAARILVYEY